jgi:hypothetical protein
MSVRFYLSIAILIFSFTSCAQVKRGELKAEDVKVEEIKARAEEASNAFIKGDYQKFVDLTYPKLVELMGGREKMISLTEGQMREMKAQGVEFMSTTVDVPREVVPAGPQVFSIVPYTLKMKTPEGVITQQSYLLAISNSDSIKWTFIDVTGLNDAQLKAVVPGAVGRVTFPAKQPPVFERNP